MGIQAAYDRAVARRRAARSRGDRARVNSATRLIHRLRVLLHRAAPCPTPDATYHSTKGWDQRPHITPRLIVLHSTESDPGSAKAVAGYLARLDTQADIHVIVDDDGYLVRLVPDGRKAWHVATFNSVALGIEQVGRAAQTKWPRDQLDAVARQIACWSRKYGIPITHSNGSGHGVVYHADLGQAGGGHHDPGEHYPLAEVLALARKYR